MYHTVYHILDELRDLSIGAISNDLKPTFQGHDTLNMK